MPITLIVAGLCFLFLGLYAMIKNRNQSKREPIHKAQIVGAGKRLGRARKE
jgi:hypothetical protein